MLVPQLTPLCTPAACLQPQSLLLHLCFPPVLQVSEVSSCHPCCQSLQWVQVAFQMASVGSLQSSHAPLTLARLLHCCPPGLSVKVLFPWDASKGPGAASMPRLAGSCACPFLRCTRGFISTNFQLVSGRCRVPAPGPSRSVFTLSVALPLCIRRLGGVLDLAEIKPVANTPCHGRLAEIGQACAAAAAA